MNTVDFAIIRRRPLVIVDTAQCSNCMHEDSILGAPSRVGSAHFADGSRLRSPTTREKHNLNRDLTTRSAYRTSHDGTGKHRGGEIVLRRDCKRICICAAVPSSGLQVRIVAALCFAAALFQLGITCSATIASVSSNAFGPHHLRTAKELIHSLDVACAGALMNTHVLVVCNPESHWNLACSAARAIGAHVLAMSPAHLALYTPQFISLLEQRRPRGALAFIGDTDELDAYEKYGLPAAVHARLPVARVMGVVLLGKKRAKYTRYHFGTERAWKVATRYSDVTDADLEYPTGAPAALTFRRRQVSGSYASASVAILLSGVSRREVEDANIVAGELQSAVSAMRQRGNDTLDVEIVILWPHDGDASPTTPFGARASRGSDDGVGTAAANMESRFPWLPYAFVNESATSRLFGSLDAIIAIEGHDSIAGDYSAPALQIALALGTPVLVPCSSMTHEMFAVGVDCYDDDGGGDTAFVELAKTVLKATHETVASRYYAFNATQAKLFRVVEKWMKFLSGTDIADGVSANEQSGSLISRSAAANRGSRDDDALHSSNITLASVAFVVSELAPVTSGGAGAVVTGLVLALLEARQRVVVLAMLPKAAISTWRSFIASELQRSRYNLGTFSFAETANLDDNLLITYCANDLIPAERYGTASERSWRTRDLRASSAAALALRVAYATTPFAAVEFFDFFGPAYATLRARWDHEWLHAPFLPHEVLVVIRAHGTSEAIDEIEFPVATRYQPAELRLRHDMERYALTTADVIIVPSLAVGHVYSRAYNIMPARFVVAPPPVPRLTAAFGRRNAACDAALYKVPDHPCTASKGISTALECVVLFSVGKMQRVKGPLTLADAFTVFSTISRTRIAHLVLFGGDAFCEEHGRHVSECVTESIPRNLRAQLHIVPALPHACVAAAVARLGKPAIAIFGSEFETFHLTAHEAATYGVPLVLPALPAYDGYFGREDAYWFAAGDKNALAAAMADAANSFEAGDGSQPALRLPPRLSYNGSLAPYTDFAERHRNARARHTVEEAQDVRSKTYWSKAVRVATDVDTREAESSSCDRCRIL